jgi:hypothetical protein
MAGYHLCALSEGNNSRITRIDIKQIKINRKDIKQIKITGE